MVYTRNKRKNKTRKFKNGGGGESQYYGASQSLNKYAGLNTTNHISINHGVPEIVLSDVNNINRLLGPRSKSFKNPIIASWCEDYLINDEVMNYCNKFTKDNYEIEDKKLERDQHYKYCSNKLKKASNKNYTKNDIIGHPIIYMHINWNKVPLYKNGLLVFYNHTYEKSTYGIDEETKHIKYLEALNNLKKMFNPIHICLYWKDYSNIKLVNLLKKYNFHFITNGHRDNNNMFLHNLINNIQNYNYITSSLIGTHTWISLYLNKFFFLYADGEPCSQESKSGHNNMWAIKSCKEFRTYYSKIYPMLEYNYFLNNKMNMNYKKLLKSMGNSKLGLSFKKSKEEIKKILI